MLEIVPEPPGGFFSNFSENLAVVFVTHHARILGLFCGILRQTRIVSSHCTFGQLCWFSGKCVFDPKVLKQSTQNTPWKGLLFGEMVYRLYNWSAYIMGLGVELN